MKALLFMIFPILALSQEKNIPDIFDSVRQGDLNKVMQYIEINPEIANSLNSHNHSILIIAAYYGQESIINYLLPFSNNINYKSENGTALAAAVVKNHLEIIKVLLNHNSDVNISDTNGVTPLMYAIMFKNEPVIKLLIQHGANLTLKDNTGKSTFEYALATENQNIINLTKN